jgi:hypothetical protein
MRRVPATLVTCTRIEIERKKKGDVQAKEGEMEITERGSCN